MEDNDHCSLCLAHADLFCMCSNSLVCRGCTAIHINSNSSTVHTFLPISAKRIIETGVDHYTVIRRAHIDKDYKSLLRAEIDNIEQFKESSLQSINRTADTITSLVSDSVARYQEQLTRDILQAKNASHEFSSNLDAHKLDVKFHDANVFFKNIVDKNVQLNQLQVFATSYAQLELDETFEKLYKYKVVCPTDQLFELTRTVSEFKEWEEELDRRKKEALRRAERCLKRFLGEYGAWNVSGPPKTDCTSFTANVDIWLLGLGMGTSQSSGSTTRIQVIEIRKTKSTQGELLYKHPEEPADTWDGDTEKKYFKVVFKEPVRILANADYTIRIQYASGGQIWAAGGTISNTVDEVTFTFSQSRCEGGDSDNNGNAVTAGPTRDIYFSLDKVEL